MIEIFALAAALQTTPAAPSAPAAATWEVHAARTACILSRATTIADRQVRIAFVPEPGLEKFQIYITEQGESGSSDGFAGTVAVNDQAPTEVRYFSAINSARTARVTTITVNANLFDWLPDVRTLQIVAKPVNLRLDLPQNSKAMVAMRDCASELTDLFGMDARAFRPGTKPVLMTDLQAMVMNRPYPPGALARRVEGTVSVVANIDAKGNVSRCYVVTAPDLSLGSATCASLAEAKFKPAKDASGMPVDAGYNFSIFWVIPKD